MAENVGTQTVTSTLIQTRPAKPTKFQVGLASWNTQVEYKELMVTDEKGAVLLSDVLDNLSGWSTKSGQWNASEGVMSQSAIEENCVAICNRVMESANYDVTVKARRTGGDEGFLLVFDYSGERNYRWFNVAGWSNTQHAVEEIYNGGKTQPTTARGHIEDGRWYTLKVEVRGERITTRIDGELVNEYTIATPDILYANAETDADGSLIVKVVNFGDNNAPVKINVKGASDNSYSVTTLKGTAQDENTKDNPCHIIPTKQTYSTPFGASSTFNAPGNSLSILRIK